MSQTTNGVTVTVFRSGHIPFAINFALDTAVSSRLVTLRPGELEIDDLAGLYPRTRPIAQALCGQDAQYGLRFVTFGRSLIRPVFSNERPANFGPCIEALLALVEEHFGTITQFYVVTDGLSQDEIDALNEVLPLNLTTTVADNNELMEVFKRQA